VSRAIDRRRLASALSVGAVAGLAAVAAFAFLDAWSGGWDTVRWRPLAGVFLAALATVVCLQRDRWRGR
jgi:hypothetical protein